MKTRKMSSVALAAAAAMMFTAVTTTASAEDAKVKCEGVNSCKGTTACATSANSCAGKNACKGQGFLQLTKADCDAAKAKAKDPEKKKS
jgi:hypothetical protein